MEIKQYGYKKLEVCETEFSLTVDSTEQSGLYFICQPTFDCNAEEEWILKIGKSNNIHKRMLQYKSMNPLGFHSEYNTLPIPASELRVAEMRCHNFLAKFAIGVLEGTNEWFIVKHGETLEQLWEIFDNRHAHWKKIAMGEV